MPDTTHQCEHCGVATTDAAEFARHMAGHQPGGKQTGGQSAPGPEDQTEAAEEAREALQDHTQTPGEAERKHDEARR